MDIPLFVVYPLSVDGHLDYFQFGAIMTKAAMKICFMSLCGDML